MGLERRGSVALGDVGVVESAFGFDAFSAVFGAGVVAARHHQCTVGFDAGRVDRCVDGYGGLAQRRVDRHGVIRPLVRRAEPVR
jgi:hypothetical protein